MFLLWASISHFAQKNSISSATQSRHLTTASTTVHLLHFWLITLSADSVASRSAALDIFILASVLSCLCVHVDTTFVVGISAARVSFNSWRRVSKKTKETAVPPRLKSCHVYTQYIIDIKEVYWNLQLENIKGLSKRWKLSVCCKWTVIQPTCCYSMGDVSVMMRSTKFSMLTQKVSGLKGWDQDPNADSVANSWTNID